MKLICPCGKTLRTDKYLGVVYYVHVEDNEDCTWYSRVGISVEKVLLQEATLPDDTAGQRARFLASLQVRLCVYHLLAKLEGEQLEAVLRSMHRALAGVDTLLYERVLGECLTVFGVVFRKNWEILFDEKLHMLKLVPYTLPSLVMCKLEGDGDVTSLIDYLRQNKRRNS